MLDLNRFFVHHSIIIVISYSLTTHTRTKHGKTHMENERGIFCSDIQYRERTQHVGKGVLFRRNFVLSCVCAHTLNSFPMHKGNAIHRYTKPGKCISKLMLFVHNCCQYIASVQSDWLGKNI